VPVSKQARAAQERQKERVAIERTRRRQAQRRRRIIGTTIAVVVVAGLAVVFYNVTKNDDSGVAVKTPPPEPTTVPGPKKCIKPEKSPAGAPAVPVKVGPAPTKLYTKDLTVGTGATVQAGDTITVNYIGVTCTTGKIFDSSYKSGTPTPVDFPLSGVIQGFQKGIPGMKVGGSRVLGIPADQAYGDQAQGDTIPANEPLWFVVDVTATKPTPPPTTAPGSDRAPTTSGAG
jgi:peptidylprolyl isomerase